MNLHVLESQVRGLRRTADDLLTEFNRALDDDTRNRIEQRAAAKRMDPVRDTLSKHRADFVDWRHAGENKALNANPSDLDEAVEVLMAVCEEAETPC